MLPHTLGNFALLDLFIPADSHLSSNFRKLFYALFPKRYHAVQRSSNVRTSGHKSDCRDLSASPLS